ncbi:hypothetical protein AGMMS4956_03400 [Bacteroidia bacterium]|nr:hypothetical protein AGMMS4956_03400 [Bacteroidia bacterium]
MDTITYINSTAPLTLLTKEQSAQNIFGKHSLLVAHTTRQSNIVERPNLLALNFMDSVLISLLVVLMGMLIIFRQKLANILRYIYSSKHLLAYVTSPISTISLFTLLAPIFIIFSLGFLLWKVVAFTSPELFFAIVAALAVFGGVKMLFCRLLDIAGNNSYTFKILMYHQFYLLLLMSILLICLLGGEMVLFTIDNTLIMNILYVIVAIFFAIYFLQMIRTFKMQKVPFFFGLLYFCTIEILPIAIVYKQFITY